jgi:hypothetical protein
VDVQFVIDQLYNYWMFTAVAVLILVGWVANLLGVDGKKDRVVFNYTEMPHMKPIAIPTQGKGFWGAIWHWFWGVREWEIVKDWHFELQGQQYVIPKGFVFDGASVPKFLASWLSPVGILLLGGLVHDFIYKYETLVINGKKKCEPNFNQKEADIIFRDINIEQNGIHVLNYAAYYALRLGGFVAWNRHRKVNSKLDI